MNKRGMFFTLIAILMVVTIVVFFLPNREFMPYAARVPTVRSRITKANNFLYSIRASLLKRALYSSSYYAVCSLIEYVNETQSELSNVEQDFAEILVNGTMDGFSLTDWDIYLMEDRTLSDKINEIEIMAEEELHLENDFEVKGVSIYQNNQSGYASFIVEVNLSYWVDADIASWNSTMTITTQHEIAGFSDPYLIINNRYRNNISFTNVTNWSNSKSYELVASMNYTYEPKAPSFLMRFENSTAESACCGMEVFLNPNEMVLSDNNNWSYADYCFYGKQCNGSTRTMKSLWNITGISEDFTGFKVELYHIQKYNLTPEKRVVQVP